jgi:hypothetical protein
MTRYKMTVVFDVHEEVEMKYVRQERIITSDHEVLQGIETTALIGRDQSHINKLYDDIIERIETSLKHPITYDIVKFEKVGVAQ